MKFYTYANQIDSKIYHRYIDGERSYIEVIKDFPIDLYVKNTNGQYRSLLGDKLSKIEFNDISSARKFIYDQNKAQEVFGQTNLLYQFLGKTYDHIEFDIKKIRILMIDIETSYSNEFPDPEKANEAILSISLRLFGTKKTVVFGYKNYTGTIENLIYNHCDDETDLLMKFQKMFKMINPHVITGWNVKGFDIPYIINRSTKIIGEQFTNKYSPFCKETSKCVSYTEDENGKVYSLLGVNVLDYLDLYKKYKLEKQENYKLDTIAEIELGRNKVDYSEYNGLMDLYDRNFNLFIEYNAEDTNIVHDLEEKMNYILLALKVAYIGKIRCEDIFSQVRFWDVYIYNYLMKLNVVIPPKTKNPEDEIIGAYVIEPIPKMYEWIVTFDLTSLYPSIIMGFNLSPETLEEPARYGINSIQDFIDMNIDTKSLKDSNLTMLANGAKFHREKMGIFGELVDGMFKSRQEYKKKMLTASKKLEKIKNELEQRKTTKKANGETDKDLDQIESLSDEQLSNLHQSIKSEVSTFDAFQNAFKISLNSLYGATGNRFFRYYDKNIAEGITMTGQLISRFIGKRLTERLQKQFDTDDNIVVAGDTDSVFLCLSPLIKRQFNVLIKDNKTLNKKEVVKYIDNYCKTEIKAILTEEFSKLADYLNMYKNTLDMKREVIADLGLWRKKKNYILQMYDKEGIIYDTPKLKIVGIEVAKSSTPKIVRDTLKDSIHIIFNGSETDLQNKVKSFKSTYMTAPIKAIASPKGINGLDIWIKNGRPILRCPIHVRAANMYNILIKQYKIDNVNPEIKNGDKIKYVYLKERNGIINSHVIAFLDEPPKVFQLNRCIDRETQYVKTFLNPLVSLTSIIGWDVVKRNKLSQFSD